MKLPFNPHYVSFFDSSSSCHCLVCFSPAPNDFSAVSGSVFPFFFWFCTPIKYSAPWKVGLEAHWTALFPWPLPCLFLVTVLFSFSFLVFSFCLYLSSACRWVRLRLTGRSRQCVRVCSVKWSHRRWMPWTCPCPGASAWGVTVTCVPWTRAARRMTMGLWSRPPPEDHHYCQNHPEQHRSACKYIIILLLYLSSSSTL